MWKLTFFSLLFLCSTGLFGQDQPLPQQWDSLSLTELNAIVKQTYFSSELEKGIEVGEVFKQKALQAPRDSQIVHIVSAYNLLGILYQRQGLYNESLAHLREFAGQVPGLP